MSENVVLSCPGCATRFSAPVAQFVPDGRQVRCSQCRHMWFHPAPGAGAAVRPPRVVATAPVRAAPVRAVPVQTAPVRAAPVQTPSMQTEPVRPQGAIARGVAAPGPATPVLDDPFESLPPKPKTGAETETVPEAPATKRGGWAGPLLWLVALLLLLAILAYVLRDPIRTAVPKAAPLLDRYTGTVDRTAQGLVGLTVARSPFELRDIQYDVKERDGEREILVQANLFNTGTSDVSAPKVRVRVVDIDRAPLNALVIPPFDASDTIPAGESTRYFVRFPAPSSDFEAVLLDVSDQE